MKAGLVIAALGDLGWEQVASGWNGAGRFGLDEDFSQAVASAVESNQGCAGHHRPRK